MLFVKLIREWYERYERSISSLFLILGFILDALTLRRADTLFENSFILGYLLIIAICIILIHINEKGIGDEKNPEHAHFWHLNILQFCFGGIFSAFLVLYFRSSDIFVVWPFLAILAVAFISNEFLKQHYIRLSFQIGLFFLSIFMYAIFIVPVLVHEIGAWIFLASGLISLSIIALFIAVLFHLTKDKFIDSKKMILILILSIFISVNFLYFTNLIPPIPLSLKDAGMYHSISKNNDGNYMVTYEDYDWTRYFKLYQNLNLAERDSAYAYSAIFSPGGLNITIIHEWQHYDDQQNKWIDSGSVNLPLVGGRGSGFRTYSVHTNLRAGKWRVNIKTKEGLTVGRLRFNVVRVDSLPELFTIIK